MIELPYLLEQWPLEQLRPHPENPRKHPKPGSLKWCVLEKALSEFNWDPIKVSRRGELVIKLFGGSGTTLAAAHQTGRLCYATELSPTFASVILERMTAYGLKVEKIHGSADHA